MAGQFKFRNRRTYLPMTKTATRQAIDDCYVARRRVVAAEALEARRFLSVASLPAADAIPFKDIAIDTKPGTTPVVKLLVDIDNNGKEDAVIGHEKNLGGGGLDIYQFPTSGNPSDHWNEISIDSGADVYESIRAADVSGNHDSHGNPVNDLVVNERGTIYWYENPLGLGKNPYTSTWIKHLIGYASQGATHEMYIANLSGVANQIDVIDNTTIFFENSPTSWTQIPTADYNRTEKGLYLFNSGSGLGAIDLLGTGDAPNYQVGWYENPRDHGGNAETGQWIFHAIGPKYGNYVGGDGVSYAAMDVNGDGREDIITSDGENGQNPPYLTGGLIWWQAPSNDITGTWTEHVIDSTITDVHNLVLADLQNDGQTEILAFEQDQSPQGRLLVLYNEGSTGQNWLEQTLASDSDQVIGGGDGGHNESVGDATGDGYLDILTSPHGYYTRVNPITLFVNEIPSDGIVAPSITSSPVSQKINANASVTFSVSATGTGPLSYQWQVNGLNISGATSSSYSISSASSGDNGNVYRCIVGNPAGLIPSGAATLTIGNVVKGTGSLVGALATAASSYNLTALGSSDWAHWGTGGSAAAFDHDASGGGKISNVTKLGTGTFGGWTNTSRTVSWTNGSPIATESSDDGYIYANTVIGSGYSFTVPASTKPETLYVFAAGNNTGAKLTATLSDSSAQPYVASVSSAGTFSNLYTITFSAASAGQTLTVSYVKSSDVSGSNGAIDLVAAALSASPVGDTTPPTAAVASSPTITAAGSAAYHFTVSYTDNVAVSAASIGSGNLLVTGNGYSQNASVVSTGLVNGSTVVVTYSVAAPAGGWSNGSYKIALNANQVEDTSGNFAAPVSALGTFSVSIHATTGGTLAGSQAAAAAGYNLTTLGTSDWAHWGAGGVYGAFDDAAGGGGQISNVTPLGSGAQYGGYSDPSRSVSWTNGTPTASDSGDGGYIWANTVLGAGYSFTVPADTTTRTVYVYAGGYTSGATLTATLSDGSAAPYVATASGTGHYAQLYAITYSAASAGQTLTISYVKSSVVSADAGGSVDLIAAALVG